MSKRTKLLKLTNPNEVIEESYREKMNTLAHFIGDYLNDGGYKEENKTGFVLFVFPFGESPEGRFNYISNSRREDIITLMREQIKNFERQGL